MAATRPTGEQLLFQSSQTGEHVLDTYLEAAEKGGREVGDMLADLWDDTDSGNLRTDLWSLRVHPTTYALQQRTGSYVDPEAGWVDVSNTSFFKTRGAHAAATVYSRLDLVTYADTFYLCVTPHTSAGAIPDSANFKPIVSLSAAGVTSFNSRSGAVTLQSGDITGVLGYTPVSPATLTANLAAYAPLAGATFTGLVTAPNFTATGQIASQNSFAAVNASGSASLLLRQGASGGGLLTSAGNNTKGLIFYDGDSAAEWARFDASGNLGVGRTPSYKLDIHGLTAFRDASNTSADHSTIHTDAAGHLAFTSSLSGEFFRLRKTGVVGIGPSASYRDMGPLTIRATGRAITLDANSDVPGASCAIDFNMATGILGSTNPSARIFAQGDGAANADICFSTRFGGTLQERMRIASNGAVSIGGSAVWHAGNDGAGSGLDADLLDGVQGVLYARTDQANTLVSPQHLRDPSGSAGNMSSYFDFLDGAFLQRGWVGFGENNTRMRLLNNLGDIAITAGSHTLNVGYGGSLNFNGVAVWHANNDGAGSGLDADLLDGYQHTDFSKLASANTFTATQTIAAAQDEILRLCGNDVYLSFFNAAGSTRLGYIQFNDTGNTVVIANEMSSSTLSFNSTGLNFNGANVWNSGNDGAGSGLDADLLDGLQASAFFQTASQTLTVGGRNWGYADGTQNFHYAPSQHNLGNATGSTTWMSVTATGATILGNTVWHAGNDGAASGLDADLLDGQQGSYYADIPARLGYTPLNSASYTAADVLAKVLTVDGAGSGLDADTVDGVQASAFAQLSANPNFTAGLQSNGIEVGFRSIPRSTTTTTLAVGDKGKCVAASATIAIPASTFAAGDAVSIYNDSGAAITLTQGGGLTLRFAGTALTGSRTLAERGMATVWFNSATEAVISGAGLS